MKQFHWGILAPGRIANSFAQGLAVLPGAVCRAVGSRDLGRARDFAGRHGFQKAYGSYEALAADPEVDIIYVATPHPWHEQAVLTCLERGKAVICEKPFAANLKQAQRMVDTARGRGVFLMEGMWTRFLPATRKALELIGSGAIGRVRHVVADFGFRAEVDPDSRLFAGEMAGGALLDVGVYNLSFFSMVYGRQPDRAQSHLTLGATGVDEAASALLNYKGGQSAFAYAAVRVTTRQEAIIYGEEGHIRLPEYWHAQQLILSDRDGERALDLPFEASGFQFEAQEVMDCLARGLTESPLMPLQESLDVMRTMDDIRFANNLRYPFEAAW